MTWRVACYDVGNDYVGMIPNLTLNTESEAAVVALRYAKSHGGVWRYRPVKLDDKGFIVERGDYAKP